MEDLSTVLRGLRSSIEQDEPSWPSGDTDTPPLNLNQSNYDSHNVQVLPGQVPPQKIQSPDEARHLVARKDTETRIVRLKNEITQRIHKQEAEGMYIRWSNYQSDFPSKLPPRPSLAKKRVFHQPSYGGHLIGPSGDFSPLGIAYYDAFQRSEVSEDMTYKRMFQAKEGFKAVGSKAFNKVSSGHPTPSQGRLESPVRHVTPTSGSRRGRKRKPSTEFIVPVIPSLTRRQDLLPQSSLPMGKVSPATVTGTGFNFMAKHDGVPKEQRVLRDKEVSRHARHETQHEEDNVHGMLIEAIDGNSRMGLEPNPPADGPAVLSIHSFGDSTRSTTPTSPPQSLHNVRTATWVAGSPFLAPLPASSYFHTSGTALRVPPCSCIPITSNPTGSSGAERLFALNPETISVIRSHAEVNRIIKSLSGLMARTKRELDYKRILYAIDTPRSPGGDLSVSTWLQIAEKVMDEVLHEVAFEGHRHEYNSPPTKTLHTFALETFDSLMRSAKWIASGAALWYKSTNPRDQIYTEFLSLEAKYFPLPPGMSLTVVQGVDTCTPAFAVWWTHKYKGHTKGILQFFIKDQRDVDKAYDYLSTFLPTQ